MFTLNLHFCQTVQEFIGFSNDINDVGKIAVHLIFWPTERGISLYVRRFPCLKENGTRW
jgi:hypothetical protein